MVQEKLELYKMLHIDNLKQLHQVDYYQHL